MGNMSTSFQILIKDRITSFTAMLTEIKHFFLKLVNFDNVYIVFHVVYTGHVAY